MNKLIVILCLVLLSGCVDTYDPVSEETHTPKLVQDHSFKLKDSAPGLYLFCTKEYHYLYLNDSATGPALREKYLVNPDYPLALHRTIIFIMVFLLIVLIILILTHPD